MRSFMDLSSFAQYLEQTYDHLSVAIGTDGVFLYHGNGTAIELLYHDELIIMKSYPVYNYTNPTRSYSYDSRDRYTIQAVVEDWCRRRGVGTGLVGIIPEEYRDEIYFWFKHLELMGYEVNRERGVVSMLLTTTIDSHFRELKHWRHAQLIFIDTGISAMWHVRELSRPEAEIPRATWAFEDFEKAQLKLKEVLEKR